MGADLRPDIYYVVHMAHVVDQPPTSELVSQAEKRADRRLKVKGDRAALTSIARREGLSSPAAVAELLLRRAIAAYMGTAEHNPRAASLTAKAIATAAELEEQGRASTVVKTRLWPDELAALDRARERRGHTRSRMIVRLVRRYLMEAPELDQPLRVDLRQAGLELASVGRNLNQIARALNVDARPDPTTEGELVRLLRATLTAVLELRRAIGRIQQANKRGPTEAT